MTGDRMRQMMDRWTRSIRSRIAGLMARGQVLRAEDASGLQRLQLRLLAGETSLDLEHLQAYGFTSVPLAGAEPALALFLQGDRSNGLVIGVADRRYRLRPLEAGDVALYDFEGQKVVLGRDELRIEDKRGNTVVLDDEGIALTDENSNSVTLKAAELKVTGVSKVTIATLGNVEVTAAGTINLGGPGGPAVARVGDSVVDGVIVTGSAKVKAT